MTRPINVEATQQEQRIEEALKGVQSGHYKSLREAARQLKIPRSTLTHRANGRQTRIQAHEDQQVLSDEEEKELARWIRQLTVFGYPPKPHAVREMLIAMRPRH